MLTRFRAWRRARRLAYMDRLVAEWRTFLANPPAEKPEPRWPGEAL